MPHVRQATYLKSYLQHLKAKTVIEEPAYFDRDYLSEFSVFYSRSTTGYPNHCRRLHFFSEKIRREQISKAASGSKRIINKLQKSYLGFVVVRPIPSAPLGRTVVRWYPEDKPNTPRITTPSRNYYVHLAGIELKVRGLAWQQQDSAVGACATIGLWTMLHSSAFDDHHAIPTTAEITLAAHKRASLGSRTFPSQGLTSYQILESIKEHELSPVVLAGDIQNKNHQTVRFSRERFCASCSSFIRSGYPVLIIGQLEGVGYHAICATGFRSSHPRSPTNNVDLEDAGIKYSNVVFEDAGIEYFYIHDDNLGPNVRFKVDLTNSSHNDGWKEDHIYLIPEAPDPARACNDTENYHRFYPEQLIVAVHHDLRTSPDTLNKIGLEIACLISDMLNTIQPTTLALSTRFIRLADYLGEELDQTLGKNPTLLGRTRLKLCEDVPPMSLHIGLVRIGLGDGTPLVDILYDTTDSDRNHPAFAHVIYSYSGGLFPELMKVLKRHVEIGIPIEAFAS